MRSPILTLFFLLIVPFLPAQTDVWNGFAEAGITSPLDGYVNKFYYYKTTSPEKQPLVISLHQWSANYAHFQNSLAPQTKAKNWNYIHPDFRGPNNNPKACGSDYVIADIDQTIEWALANLPVDESRIYIVGASGGGHAALCHFMKSRTPRRIAEYSVWVPITDLNRWYYESRSRKSRYADDILRCLSSKSKAPGTEAARARSPLFMSTPVEKLAATKLTIHAGIHDGYTGAVPIKHSIAMFNKIARDLDAPGDVLVSDADTIWMLTTRTPPAGEARHEKLNGREAHYHRSYGNISLTIFEGGHEILTAFCSADF